MLEKIVFLSLLINFPIFILFNKITNLININDKADNIRKFHKSEIPLFGGILITYNIIIFIILNEVFKLNLLNEINTKREYFSFCFGIILFFLIGIYDDKFNLSANKKLLLNFFIVFFLVLVDEDLLIKQLNFSFLDQPIYLKSFSYLFTVLCILLFLNALNMFDGLNSQAAFFCFIIFLIFTIKNVFISTSTITILVLLIFLIYNYNNKMFLGDGGTQVLAFLISYIFIKSYNLYSSFKPDEIFAILSFPGLDMFRLFIFRLASGKNPFSPDRNHIHHLIQKKFNSFQTFLLIQFFIILNLFLFYYLNNKINGLIIIILLYLVVFVYFFKKRK